MDPVLFSHHTEFRDWLLENRASETELSELGLIHNSGIAAFNARHPEREKFYSYKADPAEPAREYEEKLRPQTAEWTFFTAQTPSHQRTLKHWVMRAKREETRTKRLDQLIEHSTRGDRLPLLVSPDVRSNRQLRSSAEPIGEAFDVSTCVVVDPLRRNEAVVRHESLPVPDNETHRVHQDAPVIGKVKAIKNTRSWFLVSSSFHSSACIPL